MARFDYMDNWSIEDLVKTYVDVKDDHDFMIKKIEEARVRGSEKTEYEESDIPMHRDKMKYIDDILRKRPIDKLASYEKELEERIIDINNDFDAGRIDPKKIPIIKDRVKNYGEGIVFLTELLDSLGYDRYGDDGTHFGGK